MRKPIKSRDGAAGHRTRRFTFKSNAEKIDELNIDVIRSLDTLKPEPSSSSFFLDCLIEWRELNTAGDFISFYEEMMPLVQTLPLVFLHKDKLISELLSRLRLDAQLSLEPILRLIAELSRDLQEDFIPFLSKITASFLSLLEDGADREPEIIEQIFISWSYIIMYLQKCLARDVVYILRVTVKLRYYPKDCIRQFMAKPVSFLVRNASKKELEKGVAKILCEAARKPSEARISGVSALLWHVMRGTSSNFHSKAGRLMRLLLKDSILSIGDRFTQGSDTVTEILSTVFQRSCVELDPSELKLLWEGIFEKINASVPCKSPLHLCHLLSVLISTVSVDRGTKVWDYKPLLDLVALLVQTFMVKTTVGKTEGKESEVADKILKLMLCILDGLYSSHILDTFPRVALQWAPAFQLRTLMFPEFLKELVTKDYALLAFQSNILSGLLNLLEITREGGVYVILKFCESLQVKTGGFNVFEGTSDKVVSELCRFFRKEIGQWEEFLINMSRGDVSSCLVNKDNLAMLWGIVRCIPYFLSTEGNLLLVNLVDRLDKLLTTEADSFGGVSKEIWQSFIGATLYSYQAAGIIESDEVEHTSRVLHLAKKYKSSRQVLSAVAEYLELIYGSVLHTETDVVRTHPQLAGAMVTDALYVFSENLYNPDKGIRVSTLKILCHYELLNYELRISKHDAVDQMALKDNHAVTQCCNVFKLLLTIEETPISIATSRKITLVVSRIQTFLSDSRASEVYILPMFYGIIGLLHNQFRDLSNSALDCLSVAMSKNPALLWDRFIRVFELCLAVFLKTNVLEDTDEGLEIMSVESLKGANDLVELFGSFCDTGSFERSYSSIFIPLLQALQKIPSVVESHSRQVVPLFLRFMGYRDENPCVGVFDSHVCSGRDWKLALVEWLNLLKLMKNSRSFYRSQMLKDVLVNRLLDDNDADVQTKVLDCLLNWKDASLLAYEKHLKNLANSKFLREELATWSLSKESKLIEEEHRAELIPLVTRLLMPKVRNLRTLASRKHASVHNRKAVLGFIAQLTVHELPLFFSLLMESLQITKPESEDRANYFGGSGERSMDEFQAYFLDLFTMENILAIPWKKRYGFLHVVEEILLIFDATQVQPCLRLLMGCVVRLLESCASSLYTKSNGTQAEDHSLVDLPKSEGNDKSVNFELKQFKDMRSLCLKIIYCGLSKYENYDFGSPFWDLFFKSVKPLVHAFKHEGSSSEKPSSLFFCFLAMSQSQYLVSLLCRERNLIPDIFSILSVPTASEAIVSAVLKFTENLLTLEVEHGMEIDAMRDILISNLEGLIDSLHNLFYNNSEQKRKLLKHPGEIVLRIFKLLSRFIKDESAAKKFVDILLPLACGGTKNSGVCMEALQILRDLIPLLSYESTSKILNGVSPILISARLDLRLSICDLIDALAESDASICSMARLVRDLNATVMGDLDFDTIISAYEKITADYFYGFPEDQALVILSHCIYDMTSEEIILRQSAYRSLLSFIDFSARIIGKEMDEGTMESDGNVWTNVCIQRVVNKFLLKHMGIAMIKETTLRKEWIDLLHEMVLKLSGISTLKSLNVLCSEDAEVDFFNNIVHLQKHRRSRALSRFNNIFATEKLPEFILKSIFLPLFFNMLFDLPTGKGENIRSACLDAIASVSRQFGWRSYYDLLMRCFREITKKPDREKVLVRLVCSILDQFHFQETCSTQDMQVNLSDGVVNDDVPATTTSVVQSCLTGAVLPKLQKLLVSDPEKVNVNVSVAILKVLKLLPGNTIDSHLSSIIHRISNFLKNRLESIRDEARSALVVCLKELGVEYLKLVVKILMATLKRGFELHVLGYTVNYILSKSLLNSFGSGELDYCLDELLIVVSSDIFGEVAEQKEVDKIAFKMKETRKQMSFETLKIIAQNVTFQSHHMKLLSPVTAHLQKHLTPKVKSKLETMLTHIALGVDRNTSVNQTDLFVFMYSLIEDWLSEETRKREIPDADQSDKEKQQNESSKTAVKRYIGTDSRCSYLITVFALGLFHNRMRNIKLNRGKDQVLSMLDPFIKLMTSCLSCKYQEIIAATLKCILPLVRLPLPSLESQADKIKVTLLDIAQSSYDVNSLVTQSCLKLLAALLRSTKITLSNEQLHVLIQFPLFIDLEKNPSFVALSLLKAIVRRKLVVAEIYDIVTRVSELMVTSQEEAIRRKCSQIFLQFLLNYHLSQKRRDQHLDFLVSGLRYEHASGREAVLDMLKTIIKRFPDSIINEQSQSLFIHLVLALANDNDKQVRSLIGIVIKLLVSRISPQALDNILNHCLALYLGEKQKLWSTAAQVLGFAAEVMKKGFHKHINLILPVMKRIMMSSRAAFDDGQLSTSDHEADPFWKETYFSLVLFEKILTVMPDMFFVVDFEDIWTLISEFLIHPHPWICDISSRLVALYFEQIGKQGKKLGSTDLTSTSRLFWIGASLCWRLTVQLPDKGARKLVKCNLALVICGIQSLLRQSEFQDPHKFWSVLAPREQQCCLKACHLLGTSIQKSIMESFTCELHEVPELKDNKDLSYLLVSSLLNTMGKTAVVTEDLQCKMILGSFRLIASKLSSEDCQQYAVSLLLPIYKLSEGYAGKVVSDDVKTRADKVRQKIQETLGTQNFVQVYTQIRQSLGEKRQKRKRDEKVMAVINPDQNAKRKMRMSAKHQAHKKRKMIATKMARWMR
ncbi:uncharacterized protein LOC141657349 isoform X2 [Silene latifolia]|uniref:uncharacterized protein LOC141657349 isoform X2 n=1 Tax=Silene latifolia TaxID=37657 RepID=UPI003D779360